jgi:hypothetical protein
MAATKPQTGTNKFKSYGQTDTDLAFNPPACTQNLIRLESLTSASQKLNYCSRCWRIDLLHGFSRTTPKTIADPISKFHSLAHLCSPIAQLV